jgi:EAL domain-containing protein (putative c-di-GMP-specific phosphodiesterase class I)
VRDLDIVPLAEVIECEGEATVCRELQFELAQGFYFGKPAPVTWFSSEPEPIQA